MKIAIEVIMSVFFTVAGISLIFSFVNNYDLFKEKDFFEEINLVNASSSKTLVLGDLSEFASCDLVVNKETESFLYRENKLVENIYFEVENCEEEITSAQLNCCKLNNDCYDYSLDFSFESLLSTCTPLSELPTISPLNLDDFTINCFWENTTSVQTCYSFFDFCSSDVSCPLDIKSSFNSSILVQSSCTFDSFWVKLNKSEVNLTITCEGTPELNVFKKNGTMADKFDLVFIFENTSIPTSDYANYSTFLDFIFYSGDFALFKTEPFINNITNQEKINVYYMEIPLDGPYGPRLDGEPTIRNSYYQDIEDNLREQGYDGFFHFSADQEIWPSVNFLWVNFEFAKRGQMSLLHPDIGISPYYTDNIFTHEFGHLFANLRDEYLIPDKDAIFFTLWEGLNCIKNPVSDPWGEITGFDGTYRGGCGSSSFFRGTENSIMNRNIDLTVSEWEDGFGPINIYYLEEKLEEFR